MIAMGRLDESIQAQIREIPTEATANSMETFKKIKNSPRLKKCETALYGYNSRAPLRAEGQFTTRVQYKHNQYKTVTFIITSGGAGSLLSYATAVDLGIIQKIGSVNNANNPQHAQN